MKLQLIIILLIFYQIWDLGSENSVTINIKIDFIQIIKKFFDNTIQKNLEPPVVTKFIMGVNITENVFVIYFYKTENEVITDFSKTENVFVIYF